MGKAWRGPGWEGTETSVPLTPPPVSHMHPSPDSLWGSWKPSGPRGPARRSLASGWQGSGRWQRVQARIRVASLAAQLQRAPPVERCSRLALLAGLAGQS